MHYLEFRCSATQRIEFPAYAGWYYYLLATPSVLRRNHCNRAKFLIELFKFKPIGATGDHSVNYRRCVTALNGRKSIMDMRAYWFLLLGFAGGARYPYILYIAR